MKSHQWAGKTILDPTHKDELDMHAAESEFKERVPRDQAEQEAHSAYKNKHHKAGAAFHLSGMRAAQAIGSEDGMKEATKHGALYIKHMKALGHDPVAEPPEEIKNLVDAEDHKRVYKFKTHPADQFVVESQTSEKKEDAPMTEPKEMTKAEKVKQMWDNLHKKEEVRGNLGTIARAVGHLNKMEKCGTCGKDHGKMEKCSEGQLPVHVEDPAKKDEPAPHTAMAKHLDEETHTAYKKILKKEIKKATERAMEKALSKAQDRVSPIRKAEEFFDKTYSNAPGFVYDSRPVRKDEEAIRADPVIKAPVAAPLNKEEALDAAGKRVQLRKKEETDRGAEIRKKAEEHFKNHSEAPGFTYEG